VIIQELESLRLKIKQTQTRNIEAIDNKMNSAPLENGEKGNKKSVMTQKEFDEKALLYGLTNNEKVVTVLLLHGLEYREIAAKTKASMDKVLAITEAIYRKTGATSKIELIDLFLKNS
jgi:DNA-binding NarL/FixJ family response regulator